MSEQQKAVTTTVDQVSDPKQKMADDKEDPGPSGLLEQMFANILGAHGTPAGESEEHYISKQLDQYRHELLTDRQTGLPMEWWKQNTSRFCPLASLAKKYLSPPASSVPSERVFSQIGIFYDRLRRKCRETVFPALQPTAVRVQLPRGLSVRNGWAEDPEIIYTF